MNLTGYLVRVILSTAGQREIATTVGADPFEALVVDEDSAGLWIWRVDEPSGSRVMLLKWEHFATIEFDYEPEVPVEKPGAGFRS